jgi:hypothetical protein
VAVSLRLSGFKGLFAAGLLAVVIGYIALGLGSMTLAPLLLVGGYCLLIPVALFRLGHSEPGRERAGKGE